MNVNLYVSRVGKTVVLTGPNGKIVLKLYKSSENSAQNQVDVIIKSQNTNQKEEV